MKHRFTSLWTTGMPARVQAALLAVALPMAAQAASESHIISGSVWKYFTTGTAPAAGWPSASFDDSTWPSGPSQLGFGDGDEATVLSPGIVTAYFRTKFNVIGANSFTTLNLRVLRDDSVAVYLNGVEVYRNNLPPGPLTYDTFATATVGGAEETTLFLSASLSPSLLLEGENVIAAEVHQVNPVSSDLSFDLELFSDGDPNPPPPDLPTVTIAATDNVAAEPLIVLPQVPNKGLVRLSRTGPTTEALRVTISYGGTANNGTDYVLLPAEIDIPAGAAFQDLSIEAIDDQLVEGTETIILTLPQPPCVNAMPPGPGCYRVGAASQAAVNILDNDSPPPPPGPDRLISSNAIWRYLDNGSDAGNAWIAPAFDDSSWASGPAELGYGDGDEATVINPGPGPGLHFITTYFRHTFAIPDLSSVSNPLVRLRRDDGAVVYLNGVEVFRSNMPQGPINFATLAAAAAPDDGHDFFASPVPAALLMTGANVIAVEVHQSAVSSSDVSFALELLANSTTTPPTNPPPTPPAIVQAPQSQTVAVGADVTFSVNATGTAPLRYYWRRDGALLLATLQPILTLSNVQENQAGHYSVLVSNVAGTATSPEAVLTVLATTNPPPPATLIAAHSVWRYLDNGSDQGTAWQAPNFDDSSWAVGPGQLGYGDGDEATVVSFGPDVSNKYITTYFRRDFDLADASAVSNLLLRVLRDDGVAVYLNGIEVFRNNLPPGPVSFTTFATSAPPDENAYLEAALSSGMLVTGRNVIAAEVHQVNPASSDLGFDLELLAAAGTPPNQPPTIAITAPLSGAIFIEGTTIHLQATASDPDGSVQSVEFFADQQSLGLGQSNGGSTFQLNWSTASLGDHILQARATDDRGAQAHSVTVRISVQSTIPPGDRELHLVGIYSGAAPGGGVVHNNEFGDAAVTVNRPGKQVTLVLTAYEPTHWHVSVGAGTTLERVFHSSYYTNTVDGIPANVPVTAVQLGYTYQLDSREYLQMLPRICDLTGQDISSFHGSYGAPYPAPFVIDSVQIDPRLRCGYPQPVPTNNLPSLSFRLAFYGSGGDVYLKDYTVAGPVGGGNALPDVYLVPDGSERYYYTADPHYMWKVDAQTGSVQDLTLPPAPPELSWPMGAAFDSRRNRVLLVSLGGEGFLYAYSPVQETWTLVNSMQNLDLDALVYHAATDRLFGIGVTFSGAGPRLHELSADGLAQRSIQLPVLPFGIGPGSYRSELVSLGDYLVWLLAPRDHWQSDQESRMYLIDPRTGQVWLTYRQAGSAPDSDGDGVPDSGDQCPGTLAGQPVDEQGCSIEQLSPCNGPWTNHAQYVRAVIRDAWRFFREERIDAEQRRAIIREAAQSACGGNGTPEPMQLLLLPRTPSECLRDGVRWIVCGDGAGACVLETSSDLLHWAPVQTLDPATMGDEVSCSHSQGEASRFFRLRIGGP